MKHPIHCSFLKLHWCRLKAKRLFLTPGFSPFPWISGDCKIDPAVKQWWHLRV